MEEKINIAELLKDCPQGMELDCTMYDGLEFDSIDESTSHRPVKCRIKCRNGGYNIHRFSKYGLYDDTPHSKCVIFPKGKTTWEGFVPPCKFKDGDVIADSLGTCIFKGEGRIKGTVDYYCGIHSDYFIVKDNKSNPDGHYGNIVDYRLATEEEKEKLFQAIKDNGYKWDEETKTLELLFKPRFKGGDRIRSKNKKDECFYILNVDKDRYKYTLNIKGYCLEFKDQDNYELVPDKFDVFTLNPFDKVLVRDDNKKNWRCDYFSHFKNVGHQFICVGSWCKQCIPFNDETKHLVGKNEDCAEYYKTWEELL